VFEKMFSVGIFTVWMKYTILVSIIVIIHVYVFWF